LTLVLWLPTVGFTEPNWIGEAVESSVEWSVSKEALFVVLFHTEDVLFSKTGKANTHVRKVVRVLKPPGTYFYAPIGAETSFREIKGLKGWRVSSDGGKSKRLSRKDIATISRPAMPGFYDDLLVVVARFPGLEPGSIIAFEYDVEEKGWLCFHQRFSFQEQQPVFYVNLTVTIPEGWQLHRSGWQSDQIETKHTRSHYEWTGSRLAYQSSEPLMPPSQMYLERFITLSCYDPSSDSRLAQFLDWPSVARWAGKMLETTADDAIADRVKELTGGLATSWEKLAAVAGFVQDKIRFVAVEIGEGGWRPRPASKTLYNHYGDCKDKSVLMRAMLQSVGISSVTALANTAWFVDVEPDFPSPFVFNHAIVAIPIDQLPGMQPMPDASAKGWLFFDPTNESTPLGQLPAPLQGTKVLLTGETDQLLVSLPRSPPERNKRNYSAHIQLREDGSFVADIRITDQGSMAAASRNARGQMPMQKQVRIWERLFSRTVPKHRLSQYRTGEEDNATWVSFQLETKGYVRRAGEYLLLKPDIFRTSWRQGFKNCNRKHPIWLGPSGQVETEVVWNLPDHWIAEVEGFPITGTYDGARLTSDVTLHDDRLQFHMMVSQDGRLSPAERCDDARAYNRRLRSAAESAVLIRKP